MVRNGIGRDASDKSGNEAEDADTGTYLMFANGYITVIRLSWTYRTLK